MKIKEKTILYSKVKMLNLKNKNIKKVLKINNKFIWGE